MKAAAPARWGRVTLRPLSELSRAEWRTLHGFFRDPELAAWSGAAPTRLPRWLFRWLLLAEEGTERWGFGILDQHGRLIGNAELYDVARGPLGEKAGPRWAS
ncbi:hypothetical protein ACFP81_00820 [Deinococcus lacus]|uniref:GNAT family N-acetyltransferase n=1 Tax=Deinococcus lacus TaxID=392561 RepID=A0ABW1Y9Q3_9DEIO